LISLQETPQVRGAVLAPRQGLLKGKDRLYAARAFFETLQLQKDKKVRPCAGLGAANHAQSTAATLCEAQHAPSTLSASCRVLHANANANANAVQCHTGPTCTQNAYAGCVPGCGLSVSDKLSPHDVQVGLRQEVPLGPITVEPAANWERRYSMSLPPSQSTGRDSESQLV
jgi:hypothetical protein